MILRAAWFVAGTLALTIVLALVLGLTLLWALLPATPLALVLWEWWDVQMAKREPPK